MHADSLLHACRVRPHNDHMLSHVTNTLRAVPAGSCPYGDRCHYSHAQLSSATRAALLEVEQEERQRAAQQQEQERQRQEERRRRAELLLTPLPDELLALYALDLSGIAVA